MDLQNNSQDRFQRWLQMHEDHYEILREQGISNYPAAKAARLFIMELITTEGYDLMNIWILYLICYCIMDLKMLNRQLYMTARALSYYYNCISLN